MTIRGPRSFEPPRPDQIARREPLAGNNAASGAILERLTLTDGRRLIAKTVSPELDWIMRATHDEGRAATLFTSGLLDRLPPAIDHTTLGAERDGERWTIYMRDVGDRLFSFDHRLTREEATRVLEAMVAMHRTFQGEELTGLCDLADLPGLFSPSSAEEAIASGRDLELPDLVADGTAWTLWALIRRGWERVPEVYPADVADALHSMVEDPLPLTHALRECPCTLVHGDFKTNNLGIDDERLLVIDWGSLTAHGPGAIDFVFFLLGGEHEITYDEVTDTYRRIAGDLYDEASVDLAHLSVFTAFGMQLAFTVTEDEEEWRRLAAETLSWWIPRLRTALERSGVG